MVASFVVGKAIPRKFSLRIELELNLMRRGIGCCFRTISFGRFLTDWRVTDNIPISDRQPDCSDNTRQVLLVKRRKRAPSRRLSQNLHVMRATPLRGPNVVASLDLERKVGPPGGRFLSCWEGASLPLLLLRWPTPSLLNSFPGLRARSPWRKRGSKLVPAGNPPMGLSYCGSWMPRCSTPICRSGSSLAAPSCFAR